MPHPDRDMIALGVQQPWAELILRGVKTLEVRTVDTRTRGTIYLYASKRFSSFPAATTAAKKHSVDLDALPCGLLVGTVEIHATSRCRPADAAASCVPRDLLRNRIGWHLRNAERLEEPLPVRFLPYGVWFYPFKRKNGRERRRTKTR